MKFYQYSVAFALATAITLSGLSGARAELVYEDDLNAGSEQTEESVNEAPASQKRSEERKELTKSEMMRRQRLREELKNEDLLTQKLEELRLKDEMKRTEQLTGDVVSGVNKQSAEPLHEERVGSAATNPGAAAQVNPAMYNSGGVNNMATVEGGAATPAGAAPQTVATTPVTEEKAEETMRVSITPRGGLSSIMNSIYNIESRFSAGLGISVDVTDHIAFSGGYSFSRYALSAGNAFSYPMNFNMANLQQVNLNDNVIDFGVRGNILGPKSRVRPFIGAGVAYRTGYVNYDENTVSFLRRVNPVAAQDVNITGFSGYIETGLEFKLTKALSLTGSFKYFNMFSARQSNPLDPNAFLNPNGYNTLYGGAYSPYYGALTNGAYGYNNDTRSQASDALARNNFYQLTAGVSISF